MMLGKLPVLLWARELREKGCLCSSGRPWAK